MIGKEDWRIFIYYDFRCKKHPESIQAIKYVCDKNPDVFDYLERPCRASDFFLFRPYDECIGVNLGLDIRIKKIMEPYMISRYFQGIMLDSGNPNIEGEPFILEW